MRRVLDNIAATFRGFGLRLAILGVATVVAATLVTPPAAAQNGSAWLSPESPEPLESSGKVVLTVSMWRAGRVAYQTLDGACQVSFSPGGTPPDASCSGEKADSPEDYTATSGELIFATGGSKTITIPIVDDALEDSGEAFTLMAWEEANADPWIDRGDSVIVRIYDEDGASSDDSAAAAQGSSSISPAAGGQSPVQAAGATGTRSPRTTLAPAASSETTPPSDLPVAAPGGDVSPESEVELAGDSGAERPSDPPADRRASPFGLAAGLATAAVGVGVLAATLGRRRRGSAERG